jgi:hypothetical protein
MNSLKKNIIFIILFLSTNILLSQNLIYNGSFEIRQTIEYYSGYFIDCPSDRGEDNDLTTPLEIAEGWYDPHRKDIFRTRTFDYFHKCCDNTFLNCDVGIPVSYDANGYQFPRTGDGFLGGVTYAHNDQNLIPKYGEFSSEYFQSKLIYSLEKDTIYKFVMYVNLNNSSGWANKTIGAHFSMNKIDMEEFVINLIDSTLLPQVINKTAAITDTLNWIKISGIFQASGDEQYITIGGWQVNKGDQIVVNNETPSYFKNAAYYNFDDLALYKVSTKAHKAECGNDTLICKGESLVLGKTKIEDEYRDEYKFEWYVLGKEDSIFSLKQNPIVKPDTTTLFVLKLTDFKFDVSYDTIMVNVVECKIPTSFKVYPVPTSDIVNFEFNYPISRDMQIDLFDVNGRLINKYYAAQDFESKIVTIDLRTLASGVYIYQISFENKRKFYGKLVFIK